MGEEIGGEEGQDRRAEGSGEIHFSPYVQRLEQFPQYIHKMDGPPSANMYSARQIFPQTDVSASPNCLRDL